MLLILIVFHFLLSFVCCLAQIILFEYYLNNYFGTVWSNITGASVIYIENTETDVSAFMVGDSDLTSSSVAVDEMNQTGWLGIDYLFEYSSFTIFIPTSVFTALALDDDTREGIVRAVADKLNLAGIIYKIITY